MNKILCALIASLFLVTGCNTMKRSQTRLFKVERDHPELLVQYCAEEFPVRVDSVETERFIEGETIYEHDTIPVNCTGKDSIVYVRVVKTVHKTDTLVKEKIVNRENTAALQVEKNAHSKTHAELEKMGKSRNTYMWLFYVICVVAALLSVSIYFLLKRQYKPATG